MNLEEDEVVKVRDLLLNLQRRSFAYNNLVASDIEWTPRRNPRNVTASANVNPLDAEVRCDATAGAITMTLETAVAADGRLHYFKKIDSSANAVTIDGNGSQTIDGAATRTLSAQYDAVLLISNGTNWDVVASSIAAANAASSGTYTPTLTNSTNVAASTAEKAIYLRVGNTVHVAGTLVVDPTTTLTLTQLGISLPIASNFGGSFDCAGVAAATAVAADSAGIVANVAGDRAQMEWIAMDVTNHAFRYTFSYEVI